MSIGTINHDQSVPNTKIALIVIVLTAIFVVAVGVFAKFYYTSTLSSELTIKEDTGVPLELKKQRAYENEYLSDLKWIDKSQDRLHLPIELAMKHVVSSYN